MKFIQYFIITLIITILSSYIAASLALSFPLSGANTIWVLIMDTLSGLVLYIPILIILIFKIRHSLIWILFIEIFGFLIVLYFGYGLVATISSV